jgi:TolB protein
MKKIIFFSLIALLMSSCLPQNVQVPQSPLLATLERKSGLIAYIGVDGNMYISDQAGRNLSKLTTDAIAASDQSGKFNVYQLPTWSHDGNYLAFVGTSGINSDATSKLFITDLTTEKTNEIYTSTTEFPIYINLSPDNTTVSFISTSVAGQSLILQSVPMAGGERTIIDTGSPYYWSWAPNGRTLITHSGGASTSTTPEHLAFIELQDTGIIEDGLDTVPASFQAPAWSPDGNHILLTRVEDGKNEIILTDGAGAYEKTLTKIKFNTAFGWSNDNIHVAIIDGMQAMSAGVIGDLNILNIETDKTVLAGKNAVAFYWSPNGEKLAYFVPFFANDSTNGSSGSTAQKLVLQLNMFDVKTGESKELFTYQPTDQFRTTLPYFDQYQQSNTIWSPDNNNLVLSFLDQDGKPGIAIVAASGQLQPRILAEGYLAFWSWK